MDLSELGDRIKAADDGVNLVGVSALPQDGPCDAGRFGAAPSVVNGHCRCLVCARCGHHTGNANQGHYWSLCKVTKTMREFHFCCPDEEHGCELEEKAA